MSLKAQTRRRPKSPVSAPLWSALRSASKPQSIQELRKTCPGTYKSILNALTGWKERGIVTRSVERPYRFRLTERSQAPAGKPTGVQREKRRAIETQQRLWAAMRVLKTFDTPTLELATNTSRPTVLRYLNQLQRADYVRMVERASRLTGRTGVYRLVKNTGPKCPVASTQKGRVYLVDENKGRRVEISSDAVSLRKKSTEVTADGGVS